MSTTSGKPRLSVLTWKWGREKFQARHVNALRRALEQHLQLPHDLFCVTDDARGLDVESFVIPMPKEYAATPRCRRRMQGFARDFYPELLKDRTLYIDLDVVIVDDITSLVDRPEPIVGWKVGHAGVYSGSFLLADRGALDGAWQRFAAAPEGYPREIQPRGVPSDQAMLNAWLATQPPIAQWTEDDGLVTYYGKGYERLEHLGVGPNRRQLPRGARIVVLGSADLEVLEDESYPWVRDHYRLLTVSRERADDALIQASQCVVAESDPNEFGRLLDRVRR